MWTNKYLDIKRNTLFKYLDKFPDVPNKTLARIIYRDQPELFESVEDARNGVRRYRGCKGKIHRSHLTITKYLKNDKLA
jgi:hypothetical protein